MKKLSENCNSLYYVTFSWLKKCHAFFWITLQCAKIISERAFLISRSFVLQDLESFILYYDTYNRIRMKYFVNQICIKNRNAPSKNDITHCAQTKEQSRYLILMIFIFLRSVWIFAAGGVTTSSITVTAYILLTVRS